MSIFTAPFSQRSSPWLLQRSPTCIIWSTWTVRLLQRTRLIIWCPLRPSPWFIQLFIGSWYAMWPNEERQLCRMRLIYDGSSHVALSDGHAKVDDTKTSILFSGGRGLETRVWQRLTLRAGVCQRRVWPTPVYRVSSSRAGYTCVVRVNNREYQTRKHHDSEILAKEAAATTAYSIVANFSAHHQTYPAGFTSGGVIQGNPIPVGSGRHVRRVDSGSDYQANTNTSYAQYGSRDVSNSPGSSSGTSSPEKSWAMPSSAERRVSRHHATELPMRHNQESARRHQEPPRNRHRY